MPLLLLIDECLPEALVVALETKGHDVVWARKSYSGWDDALILAAATQAARIVVSEDRDFGTLTVRQAQPAVGVVIVQFDRFTGSLGEVSRQVANRIHELGQACVGRLTTIEPARVRQRALHGRS